MKVVEGFAYMRSMSVMTVPATEGFTAPGRTGELIEEVAIMRENIKPVILIKPTIVEDQIE